MCFHTCTGVCICTVLDTNRYWNIYMHVFMHIQVCAHMCFIIHKLTHINSDRYIFIICIKYHKMILNSPSANWCLYYFILKYFLCILIFSIFLFYYIIFLNIFYISHSKKEETKKLLFLSLHCFCSFLFISLWCLGNLF